MSKDIAAEIEKEYGPVAFKHPVILFGYNKIEITQKFDIYTKIFLLLALTPLIGLFFVLDFSLVGFFMAIPFICLFGLFYNYHNYFDKIAIDFLNKELTVTNRFWIVNKTRKLIKINSEIPFQDISYFMIDNGEPKYMLPGRSSNFYMKKTSL